jgi:hypothetical protein
MKENGHSFGRIQVSVDVLETYCCGGYDTLQQ